MKKILEVEIQHPKEDDELNVQYTFTMTHISTGNKSRVTVNKPFKVVNLPTEEECLNTKEYHDLIKTIAKYKARTVDADAVTYDIRQYTQAIFNQLKGGEDELSL